MRRSKHMFQINSIIFCTVSIMPEPYNNPDRVPFIGSYQWVPPTPKSGFGGETYLNGFDTMIIDRGSFVNLYPGSSQISSVIGLGDTIKGIITDPILNAFRPLSAQNVRITFASGNYVSLIGTRVVYSVILSQSSHYSGIGIGYDLSISLYDDGIIKDYDTTGMAQTEIAAYIQKIGFARTEYQQNIIPNLSFIDFNRLQLGQVMYQNSDGSYQEFPPLVNTKPVQLPITRIRLTDSESYPNTSISIGSTFIKIVPTETLQVTNFPISKGFKIQSRAGLASSSFILNINKFQVFDAARVNFRKEQLPASLMSYSFGVNGTYFYRDTNNTYWPQAATPLVPDFHIKFFNPDYTTNSPGMAHSLSVWVFLIVWPFFGPLEDLLFPPGSTIYNYIVIGPEPSLRKNNFYFNHSLATYNQNLVSETPINLNAGRSAILTKGFSDLNNVSQYDLYYLGPGGVNNPTNTNLSSKVDLNQFPSGRFEIVFNGTYITPDGKISQVDDKIQFITIAETQQTALVQSNTYAPEYIAELQPMVANTENSDGAEYQNFIRYFDNINNEDFNNIIGLKPLAIFVQSLENPFSNPINIQSGIWNFYIKCASLDTSQRFNSRLFLRLWFVPEDFNFVDTNALYAYQQSNEFYFDTAVNGTSYVTNIKKGTPTSSDQLFITSPLSTVLQQYVFSQYVSNSMSFQAQSSPNSRLRLVIGVYGYSVLAYPPLPGQENNILVSPEYPKLQLDISPTTTRLETTITQTLSNADILPIRDNKFSSVSETNYTTPLDLLNILVNNTIINGTYITYKNALDYSSVFSKLLVLGDPNSYSQNLNFASINLSPKTITDFMTTDNSAYVDFATSGTSLYNAIVNSGAWSIEVDINYPDAERSNIIYELSFEGILVDYSGNVVARIFRSPYMTATGSQFKYNFNITFGFSVPETDIQFVLRVYYIGYSATNTPVNIDTVAKTIAPLPVGIKIDKLVINSNTLALRTVDQNSSAGGSPSFYEDLPLITSTVDDPAFWLIFSSNTLSGNQNLFDDTDGLSLFFSIYSPTFSASNFSNMEVKLISTMGDSDPNARNLQLGLRTAKGATSSKSLTSSQDKLTGKTIVGGIQVSTNVNTPQSIFSVDSDSEGRLTQTTKTLTGLTNDGPAGITGANPASNPYKSFLMGYQNDVSAGTNFSIVKGEIDVNQFTGPNYAGQLVPTNLVTSYVQNTVNCILLYENDRNLAHILGFSGGSFLIHKEVDIVNEPIYPQVASGLIYVIEGDSSKTSNLNPQIGETLLFPDNTDSKGLNGAIDSKFSSIIYDNKKVFYYAYILGSSKTLNVGQTIYGRAKINSKITTVYPIVSIPTIFNGLNLSSDEQTIVDNLILSSPVLLYNSTLDELSIIFWCGTSVIGKIFHTRLDKNFGNSAATLSYWTLVAGSYTGNIQGISADQKSLNAVFQKAIDARRILISKNFSEELSIPEQKPAAFPCEYGKSQFINSFFVQYYANDTKINEKIVMSNGTVLDHTNNLN